ncbi:MAG: enoyl-CoA hydratase [Candidatus Eisenbacteria bacterium]|uniref:Enoyl-CoA hydratase n=1 Tax=Eiseniibacteriota bacterium TaxID=2212470 RepID=A0A849SQE7_UNCEI|nr:enoyl-CoA hydratase [Candidatus Eisenbacteria bacterium]
MATTSAAPPQNLLVETRGAVTIVTVNRPEVLNALNRATLIELDAAAQTFVEDPAQHALIVTGQGEKSFIAGADIAELAALDSRGAVEASRFGQRVYDRFELSPKPVIAAINGYALGGGCELALACHLRIASENAVLGLPEVTLGIIPGYGGTQRLPRLIGPGRALELMLTARRVKADEAERIGLVNRVVPRDQLLDEAEKLALAILKNGPLAIAAVLESVQRGLQTGLNEALRFESALFGMMFASHDTPEGLQAFLEKRPPRFERR